VVNPNGFLSTEELALLDVVTAPPPSSASNGTAHPELSL